MISAASSPPDDCWSESIEAIIRNCLDINYSLLARRAQGWMKADRALRQAVIDKVESSVTVDRQTGFGTAFPDFVRCVIQPTGGNFHTRMHNSNGKQIIAALLVASLGNCLPLNKFNGPGGPWFGPDWVASLVWICMGGGGGYVICSFVIGYVWTHVIDCLA